MQANNTSNKNTSVDLLNLLIGFKINNFLLISISTNQYLNIDFSTTTNQQINIDFGALVVSILPHAEFAQNDHRYDFINLEIYFRFHDEREESFGE